MREHTVGSALVPRAAGAIAGRAAVGVDPDTALDQTADARSLMPVQIGAAAGWERDAVAAQKKGALRQRLERGGELQP